VRKTEIKGASEDEIDRAKKHCMANGIEFKTGKREGAMTVWTDFRCSHNRVWEILIGEDDKE
jgi:hypothetical protein